jgi:hypothetical protein
MNLSLFPIVLSLSFSSLFLCTHIFHLYLIPMAEAKMASKLGHREYIISELKIVIGFMTNYLLLQC